MLNCVSVAPYSVDGAHGYAISRPNVYCRAPVVCSNGVHATTISVLQWCAISFAELQRHDGSWSRH